MLRLGNIENSFVYIYTVYWTETKFDAINGSWKKKDFFLKKAAQEFAKSKRKEFNYLPVKPYILKSIGFKDNQTKEQDGVEIVTSYGQWKKYFLSSDTKKIRY